MVKKQQQYKPIKPIIQRTEKDNELLRQYALAKGLPERIYEDFGVYAKFMLPKIGLEEQLDWAWFHYAICERFNSILFGKTRYMTMEIGPQVGKSLFTGLFISYVFGLLPNFGIMYATYNEDKAIDFTKKYLIMPMGSDKFKQVFEHISLKNELDKKDQSKQAQILRKTQIFTDTEFTISNALTNTSNGRFKAVGMEQGIHGRPANLFIIDDYVGKGEDTYSEIFREKRKRWFQTDMPSRLQGNDSILVALCTRWYFDDIIGLFHDGYYDRVIPICKQMNWEVPKLEIIKYRAEYRVGDEFNDPNDPRTEEGQLLWEEHALKYAWAKGQEDDFDALYNCDPKNTDHSERIKLEDFGFWTYDTLPKNGNLYIVVDPASTGNKDSDKSAIQVWYVVGRKRYLLKLYYVKLDTLPLCDYVYDLVTENYPDYFEIIVEHASSGITLCQYLTKTKQMRNVVKMWFNGLPVNSEKKVQKSEKISGNADSKLDRYLRILPEFRQAEKLVFLPQHDIEHKQEFIRQLTKFTGKRGARDDHADAAVYLLLRTKRNVVTFNPEDTTSNFVQVKGYSTNGYGIKVI